MWQKKGHIFNVSGDFEWNRSHAQVPVVDELDESLRIYYATRNEENKSTISFIEVDKTNPTVILYEHNKPILDFGKLGTFDDSGVMPTSIITINKLKYLYYIGWTTRGTVPYHNAIGLAVSNDGGTTFSRMYEGPIITVNKLEPYFSGTAFVFQDDNIFKMYYLSCIAWKKIDNRIEPFYEIKYAESDNGIDWNQTNKTVIKLNTEEGGLVSASVIKSIDGQYVMWYGFRSASDYRTNTNKSYRIGFATSEDGIRWNRKDNQAGIITSEDGWDSQMISYPFVKKINNDLFMFYNGNGFGKSGFGYAIWENDRK